ncbi:type II toxin-antitoxin system VapC family toxin [Martelella soudanensis]|uniref:type II toxin-antitoxin system VapC family toxin n=1 Tax=unclassified Martelella TaxID=2629616 RepID=UPI0015DF392C|nr:MULTISPECIES: type II toxin-antitoxin system VapC family toxin [unclassified Martelella]
MSYLFDTNAISDMIRRPAGKIAQRLVGLEKRDLKTSLIVAAELRYGVVKRGSKELSELMERVLSQFEILPWEPPADIRYAELRNHLRQIGQPIGDMDMLIAAHALAIDAVVVTANEREFERVPGLKVENWERD